MADEQTPAPLGGAGGVFRALIPERTVEDVLGGKLTLSLGETPFTLKVLTIEKADGWRKLLEESAVDILGQLGEQANAATVLSFMGMHTPTMLGLIHEYDEADQLPDDKWIYSHASEPDILRGFMLCVAASYPFVAAALEILAANPQALRLVLEEFGPTSQTPVGKPSSTSPAPTAGTSRKRAPRSRTSNSTAT